MPKGKLLSPRRSSSTKQTRSRGQETAVALALGGRRTTASGAGPLDKNDVVAQSWSVECKDTTKLSFRLETGVLRTAEFHALTQGKQFLLHLRLGDREYAVLGWDAFLELAEKK